MIIIERRTSGAKAVHVTADYGTAEAEAVPFVQSGRRGQRYVVSLSRQMPPLSIRNLGRYTAGMYQMRAATPADAAVITHHRRRMFVDAGRQDNRVLDVMAEYFKPWVETRLADGRYIGWLTSENGTVVAGAGLIVLDWPPHPLDPRQDKRGYLLNVYVEPEHRRKKLASQLIDQALAEARKQKIRVVALHSTDEGRPLYESNGFRRTNEMFYVEAVEG